MLTFPQRDFIKKYGDKYENILLEEYIQIEKQKATMDLRNHAEYQKVQNRMFSIEKEFKDMNTFYKKR